MSTATELPTRQRIVSLLKKWNLSYSIGFSRTGKTRNEYSLYSATAANDLAKQPLQHLAQQLTEEGIPAKAEKDGSTWRIYLEISNPSRL